MRKISLVPLCLAPAVYLLSGCAHVRTTTTLHQDGSYERQESFTVPLLTAGKGFNTYFHFRAQKDGIFYDKKDESMNSKLIVTRQGMPGAKEPLDMVVMGGKNKPIMNSQVSVTKREDGAILYTERLHWLGPSSSFDLSDYFSEQRQIRDALPPAYRNQKTAVFLTGPSSELMNSLLLGPSKPSLLKLMMNEEVGKIQLLDKIEEFLDAHKEAWLPGISDDDRNRLAQKILSIYLSKNKAKLNATNSIGSGTAELPELEPLSYVVSPPGKILETNGQVTKDGRVYWALLPQATAKHDVVLTVLCRPAP